MSASPGDRRSPDAAAPAAGTPGPEPPSHRANADGPAASFRTGRGRSVARRRRVAGGIAAALIAATVVFLVLHSQPAPAPTATGSPGGGSDGGGGPSSKVSVTLGTPDAGTTVCGSGGSSPSERIPWLGSSVPISTAELNLLVVELADGDILPGIAGAPGVTSTDPCEGNPPGPSYHWYLVLSDPSGANVAYYTLPMGWVTLAGGAANLTVANGSSFLLLISPSVAGIGYGLALQGFVDGVHWAKEVTL